MTANYLSITRLVLSVLAVTIVAERHILETAFFSQKCCKQKSFDANSSLSTKLKTNTRSALSESLSFFFFFWQQSVFLAHGLVLSVLAATKIAQRHILGRVFFP